MNVRRVKRAKSILLHDFSETAFEAFEKLFKFMF